MSFPKLGALCRGAVRTAGLLSVAASLLGAASLPPAPTWRDEMDATLRTLCDTLVATQITAPQAPDRGALVCPSTNPQDHPLHSRAAEAVYPLTYEWRKTGDIRYRDAAIRLGDWLITKQQPRGAWGEDAPKFDGWTGTTADQLISLAAAYPLLRATLPPTSRAAWERAIHRAADYIVASFPMGPTNYQPTGAVALELARRACGDAPAAWSQKARSLIASTLAAVNADGFVTGEGGDHGVDLGYNLAQTIGFLALYGRLTSDEHLRDEAARRLRVHAQFVYPNGTVDNSWGTRAFKWTYESGTKTAPGVYFTFALLADKDPSFAALGHQCFDYLRQHTLRNGFITYGPGADRHASTTPPCLYGTFVRAQSLAMALAFGAAEPSTVMRPAVGEDAAGWCRFFPTVQVALVRTPTLMATVSVNGNLEKFTRELVGRGGSITNLWLDGVGALGLVQTSSVNIYKRQELPHMPIEPALLPLTPRLECTLAGETYNNLYDVDAGLSVVTAQDHVAVTTRGRLVALNGAKSAITFILTHRFYRDRVTKEYQIAAREHCRVRVVEPFVRLAGTEFRQVSARQFDLHPAAGRTCRVELTSAPAGTTLTGGADAPRYWCPFPAVDCYPITCEVAVGPEHVEQITLAIEPAR